MEETPDFDYIDSTYWHMFSYSHLNVFLDRKPHGNVFRWRLKRFMNYFFLYFYFPLFFTIQMMGIFMGREGNLPQIAFDISYIAHLIQVFIKTNYFIYKIEDIRSLCLRFEEFHTARHRPVLARVTLGKQAHFLRKLAKMYYTTIYMNMLFWSVSPLIIQPIMYLLTQSGLMESNADTIIPKFFPVRYPFDETTTQNRVIIAFLEVIVLTAGFIYFIPIDQFFCSVIVMVCGQMELIAKSVQSRGELAQEIGGRPDFVMGPQDDPERIDIRLFISDHQRGIGVVKRISQIINPVLGVTLTNSMVCLGTLAIVITKKAKTTESFIEFAREVGGFCLVMTTSVISLYLYSWMCGELKKGEEGVFFAIYSSNWYEQKKKYRVATLLIMGQSFKTRALKALGIGNVDRETFIQLKVQLFTLYANAHELKLKCHPPKSTFYRRTAKIFSGFQKAFAYLSVKKTDFYRKLNPMDRIYNVYHTTLFCFGSQNAYSYFFFVPLVLQYKGIFFVVFYAIYAVLSFISATCIAELAELLPSTGSVYHYAYYSMGEFVAFMAGWNIIFYQGAEIYDKIVRFRHIVDRALLNDWVKKNLNVLPSYEVSSSMKFGGMLEIYAPIILIPMALLSSVFLKSSPHIMSSITIILIIGMVIPIGVYIFFINLDNFIVLQKPEEESYVMSSFVYAVEIFTGYEFLGILGEESKKPQETIPRSVLLSMMLSTSLIFINMLLIGLVWPKEDLNDLIWPHKDLANSMGIEDFKWLSFIASICGFVCCIYANFFMFNRLLYAMSRDGLIFSIFSKVDRKTLSPLYSSIIAAGILIVLAQILGVEARIFEGRILSRVATKILTYVCLLYTRYSCEEPEQNSDKCDRWLLINWPRPVSKPTTMTHLIANVLIYILCMAGITAFVGLEILAFKEVPEAVALLIRISSGCAIVLLLTSFLFLSRQPQNDRTNLKYKVPDVPMFPVIAILTDIMICISPVVKLSDWVPVISWWGLGIIMYFAYSVWHSNERNTTFRSTRWTIMTHGKDSFYREDDHLRDVHSGDLDAVEGSEASDAPRSVSVISNDRTSTHGPIEPMDNEELHQDQLNTTEQPNQDDLRRGERETNPEDVTNLETNARGEGGQNEAQTSDNVQPNQEQTDDNQQPNQNN